MHSTHSVAVTARCPLPRWLSFVTSELFSILLTNWFLFCAGVEFEKTGPHLELPGVLLALFCLSPLQAATAELLPFVTMPLFVLLVQPDVLGDCEVADVLLSAMRAYAGLCILDNPLLSPHGTLSKVIHIA